MFQIKKLDIFITKQFGLLFVGTFFICQFVLMMQFLWRYVDELIGKGLSLDVMAQFFWYMGLMLIPQALPLAILLSALISFGNLGESSELTAIKAAGISLMQAFRPLIVIVCLIAGVSYTFQDQVAPVAQEKLFQLLVSMKQKSPELEIPEGIFYGGIPGTNIYVQKKDMSTGMLYGVMIYRQSGSYDDQAIILADSGMMQSTEEKKHLVLKLYDGVWNENMRSSEVAGNAQVPYRRETFASKQIVLDFDGNFELADMSDNNVDAKAKSMRRIFHDMDSIREANDSTGWQFYREGKSYFFRLAQVDKADSLKAIKEAVSPSVDFDSVFAKLKTEQQQLAVKSALNNAQTTINDLDMKANYANYIHRYYRTHIIEAINKITLSLSCLIFFFIGAPLGAIIRKGGLGVPVIISVLVFIVYYIFENSGMRMARDDQWTVWFGKLISTAVLTPIAIFFTYKANKDSVVFNIDLYKSILMNILGLRTKRHIYRKEVVIEDPKYDVDADLLINVNLEIEAYSDHHKLYLWPNPIKVFFHAGDDQEIEKLNHSLEVAIEDLSYTKDKLILSELNNYPVIAVRAHTRPFRRKWMNIVTGLILPLGIFFYFRMIRFRLRLYRDLRAIRSTTDRVLPRIMEYSTKTKSVTELI